MESAMDYHEARALLEWQVELGVSEAIGETPVDRYALSVDDPWRGAKKTATAAQSAAQSSPIDGSAKPAKPAAQSAPAPAAPAVDAVAVAKSAAENAVDLDGLKAALAGFEHCEMKRGARNLVFGEGAVGARVMIIGEAPGREEDREGRPFVGPAGHLLDKMLAAIDMGRDHDAAPVYLTNVLPWRPPQNRDPKPDEIAMLRPFLERHVALVNPDVIVLMGNIACQAALGKRGITRLRGEWGDAFGRPALPMLHPAYLLREPHAKRDAWADLLALKAKLAPPA